MITEISTQSPTKQSKRTGVFIFYLLAFFIPYQMEFDVPQLLGVTLTPVNILGLILLTFLSFRVLVSLRLPIIRYWRWWLLFVIMASVAYALGPRITGPLQGAWVIFRLALIPPLFYAGAVVLLTASDVRRVIKILAVSAAVAGLVAVTQILSGGQVLGGYLTNYRYLGFLQPFPPEVVAGYRDALTEKLYLTGTSIYRGHGTFYTANGFGAFLSTIACLSWGLLRGAPRNRRWFWFIVFVALVMGSIASFSRSSWAALVAGVGVAIFIEVIIAGRRRFIFRVIRLMPVFFVLAVIIGVIVTRSEKVANHFITIFSPEETSEFQWRQLVWENALEKITVNPWIGSGTDSAFTVVDWNGVETSYSAHNLLIGLAYELGVLNLIIFLLFLASLFRSAWRCVKYAPLPSDRLLAIGFIAVGVSFLVSGVGSALMNIENIAALFWLMVGLAVTLRREARQYYRRIQEVPHENSDGRIPAMATSN